jgi:aryl-alcohol dehydrogenase-like predicted oxidoreductase
MTSTISRRDFVGTAVATAALSMAPTGSFGAVDPILRRAIPHSGEMVPVVGLGTYAAYKDATDPRKMAEMESVVGALTAVGPALIDTASSYGGAETLIGNALASVKPSTPVFIATKVESTTATDAETEIRQSLAKLKVKTLDCVQLHNVKAADQSLSMFRAFKQAGLLRYYGVTSTFPQDYAAMEAVVRREKPDFMEPGYSIADRQAEDRLLPAAMDAGTAVLVALPLGRNAAFKAVGNRPLPDWVTELDITSWGQFFLKYVLGHPAITAVIPGTTNPAHMADDLAAGRGRMPNAEQRKRMLKDYLG